MNPSIVSACTAGGERDGRIRVRMLAVHMRCAQDRTEDEVASALAVHRPGLQVGAEVQGGRH